MTTDPLSLTQQLIRFPSVTPLEAGALSFVAHFLQARGFRIERLDCEGVSNLYARLGTKAPHFCFAGHTDVVPPGELSRWSLDPFQAEVRDGILYGRGVVDMKGGIGAFLSAVDQFLQKSKPKGSLSVLLTSDEEGPATFGIKHVVSQFLARGEHIDACLVGEPSNVVTVGDTIKVGRRGSLNATLTIQGTSGHVAYPQLANNPIPLMITLCQDLLATPLDHGMENFDPSNLEITSIDVGNPTANVIPSQASVTFNIRYNPLHTAKSLKSYLKEKAESHGLDYSLDVRANGDPLLCHDEKLQDLVCNAIKKITKQTPNLSTSGGTSDARFLKDICPVIEFGLISTTAHHVDEHIAVDEIEVLSNIYHEILQVYFS